MNALSVERNIVLIYDNDCPNVEAARNNLVEALRAAGASPTWQEVDRASSHAPGRYREFGSPTILVDGRDVVGCQQESSGACCRIYPSVGGGYAGAPTLEQICGALASSDRRSANAWKDAVLSLPAIGLGLLPSVTCPACWPAYAAFLGAIGIGFMPTARVLLPLTIVAVLLVLAAFGWRALRIRRYGPFVVAGAAAALLVAARLLSTGPLLQYLGVAGFIAASIWNMTLQRRPANQEGGEASVHVVDLENSWEKSY